MWPIHCGAGGPAAPPRLLTACTVPFLLRLCAISFAAISTLKPTSAHGFNTKKRSLYFAPRRTSLQKSVQVCQWLEALRQTGPGACASARLLLPPPSPTLPRTSPRRLRYNDNHDHDHGHGHNVSEGSPVDVSPRTLLCGSCASQRTRLCVLELCHLRDCARWRNW